MTALGLAASLALLLGGVVGYMVTGSVWLLVLAGLGLVVSVSGWVLTRGGSRQR